MYVKFDNTATSSLHDRECMPEGYVVSVPPSGLAQVKQDVGKALIDKYGSISEYNGED